MYPEADLEGGVRGVRPPKIRKTYVIQRDFYQWVELFRMISQIYS
jgi:hypothetical protein